MLYVNWRENKLAPERTSIYEGETGNGETIFAKDFNGKRLILKKSQVVKIYEAK